MAAYQLILYQRICRYSGCHTPFCICRHCDRGQCYCSPVCRRQARLQQQRRANRRYQQSVEARLDQRDRQRAYRCRRRQTASRVTDHTSPASASPALCGYAHFTTALVTAAAGPVLACPQLRCIRCGATGHFVAAGLTGLRRRGAPSWHLPHSLFHPGD